MTPDQEAVAIEAAAEVIHTDTVIHPDPCLAPCRGKEHRLAMGELILAKAIVTAIAEHLFGSAPAAEEAPLPEGQFGRVELPGYRQHTGWVTEETRFGVQMAVIRDWDGHEIAAAAIGANSQVVYLPTPRKRPDSLLAIATAIESDFYEPDGDDDEESY